MSKVKDLRLRQPSKAYPCRGPPAARISSPIFSTEAGIAMLSIRLSLNAAYPIDEHTLPSAKVTLLSDEYANAELPILVTLAGMTTEFTPVYWNTPELMISSAPSAAKVTEVSFVHLENA